MATPFIPCALVWLVGLWAGNHLSVAWWLWAVLLLVPVFGIGRWLRRHPTRYLFFHHPPIVGLVLTLFLLGGMARGAAARPVKDAHTLSYYNDHENVTLLGTIDRYPERRSTYTQYILSVDALRLSDDTTVRPVTGRLVVNLPPYPAYTYGDQLQLTGNLTTPFTHPFDYRAYLATQGIASTFRAANSALLQRRQGAPLLQGLMGIRLNAEQTIGRILPEPHAALLKGILLGLDDAIPEDVKAAFTITGTTHILVISGANFALLAGSLVWLGQRWLGKQRGIIVALGFIVLYALLVGGDPPVLRAAVMGGVSMIALLSRRASSAFNALGVTVFGLTLLEPLQGQNIGFQLSVLATIALIIVAPPLTGVTTRWLARLRVPSTAQPQILKVLSDVILITLAAQLVTTPLIVGIFGRLSLVSLLTNALILPAQDGVMKSGLVATLAGMVWTPLGQLLAVLPYAALNWTLWVIELTAKIPYASIEVGPFPAWQIWTLYGIAGLGWWLMTLPAQLPVRSLFQPPAFFNLTRRTLWMGSGVIIATIAVVWVLGQRPDGQLHLYMLDVGQGDALMIVTPDGKQLLIDGGPEPAALLREVSEVMPFWDRTIDLVLLTHPDADHLGGLPDLLSRYEVAAVADSGQANDTEWYTAWQVAVQQEGVAPLHVQPGQTWQLGKGATLEVLAPRGIPFETTNQNSIVLRLQYGSFCALLTGDIEAETEARLVNDGVLSPCQVLKIAHHGSATSTSPAFLEAVRPAYALISVGNNNRFGHPNGDVLQRLADSNVRVFRTDQAGTIHLVTDGSRLGVETDE